MDLVLQANAKLTNINNRIEHHGEDRVAAVDLDITIEDIEAGELDQLSLDGSHYSTSLWNKEEDKGMPGGYKLTSPKFTLLKVQTIDVKVETHKAVIAMETAGENMKKNRGEIHINPAVIKKIKFTPKHHGLADLSIQIQGNLTGAEVGKIIDRYLGERISVEIEPLNESLFDEPEGSEAA